MNEIVKIQVDLNNLTTFPKRFVNKSKLDATTEEQIMEQEKQDDEQARSEALNKNVQYCWTFFITDLENLFQGL